MVNSSGSSGTIRFLSTILVSAAAECCAVVNHHAMPVHPQLLWHHAVSPTTHPPHPPCLHPLCVCVQSMTGIPPPGSRMVPILEGVSGVLKPGRLTLLLGHPGSGKTVLLKALAGQLRGNPSLKARGGERG